MTGGRPGTPRINDDPYMNRGGSDMSKLGKKKSTKEGKTKQLQQQLQALQRKNAGKTKK